MKAAPLNIVLKGHNGYTQRARRTRERTQPRGSNDAREVTVAPQLPSRAVRSLQIAEPLTPTPLATHLAGFIAVASVVAVDPGGWYPFVVAKWGAVAVAVVVAWTAAGRTSRTRLPRIVTATFGTLVAVMVIAAVFGRDPLYAWTGTPERHLGVLTWVLFAAALTVGSAIDSATRRRVVARWIVVALAWSTIYGAAELVGRDPIQTATMTSRITGPYGSASMFGAALCLLIPVAFGLAADKREQRPWRLVATITAALGVATVAMTGTRAAWVGLAVAAAFIAIAQLGLPRTRTDARAVLPLMMVGGLGLIGGAVGISTSSGVTERVAGGTSRLAEWGVGWQIIAAHPLLGVGPEGYRTSLADGVSATYERTYGRSATPDRAHNVLLDVGASGGVIALALYAVLIAVAVYAAWRVVRSPGRQPVAVGIAVATIAYTAQQMFLFPVSTIDPVLWMLVASTAAAAWPRRSQAPGLGKRRAARLVVGSLLAGVLFADGVVAVAADRAARQAVTTNDLAAAERAAALRPDVVRYRLLVASLEPKTITGQRAAIDATARALSLSPHDPILERRHADALLRLAISTGAVADIDVAVQKWQELAAADANCYQCALGLGYASALAGDTSSAIDAFTRAQSLARDGDNEAQTALHELNSQHAQSNQSSRATTVTTEMGTDHDG